MPSRRFTARMAFILNAESIRWLSSILPETGGSSYLLSLRDGSSLEYSSPDEVLSFPNTDRKPVESIRITAGPYGGRRVSLSLSARRPFDNVEYEVSGEEPEVIVLSERLDEWLGQIRPWYSRLATVDLILFFLGLWLVAWVGLNVWALGFVLTRGDTPLSSSSPTLVSQVLVNLFFIAPFALGGLLSLVRPRIFPVGVFSTGYGLARNRRYERTREILGISIGLALLVGTFKDWFMARF